MAQFIPIALIAAVIFGICYLVDKTFSKLFRSKAQHRSGKAVRANKRYGIFVLLMGVALAVYYLSFGIFYDGESLLLQRFGKKDVTHSYKEIVGQKLYLIQGGNIVVELHMADGSAVSVQSAFDGVYPFLDTAFAGWCLQKGIDPASCDFHDPSKSWWFPHEEE